VPRRQEALAALLVGEAKWHAGEVDSDALAELEGTARSVPGSGPETKLVVYARDGFSARLRSRAAGSGVLLGTVADLYAG